MRGMKKLKASKVAPVKPYVFEAWPAQPVQTAGVACVTPVVVYGDPTYRIPLSKKMATHGAYSLLIAIWNKAEAYIGSTCQKRNSHKGV